MPAQRAKAEQEKVAGSEIQPVGTGDFGPIYDQFKGKPKEAVKFLMSKKEGEAIGALRHKDIGDIDLVWGKEGTGQSDGYGLAKLVKYHPEVLNNLQEILDDMHVVKRTANRIQLESDTHQATVRLTWNEQKKNWLLTAFEKKSSALDNTTDTAKTLSGKRNDTATPQNTAFISNNSKSSETKQEKAEKPSENQPQSNGKPVGEEGSANGGRTEGNTGTSDNGGAAESDGGSETDEVDKQEGEKEEKKEKKTEEAKAEKHRGESGEGGQEDPARAITHC